MRPALHALGGRVTAAAKIRQTAMIVSAVRPTLRVECIVTVVLSPYERGFGNLKLVSIDAPAHQATIAANNSVHIKRTGRIANVLEVRRRRLPPDIAISGARAAHRR
ncbi:MAG TPA: hypothetical protein VNE82_20630 [Candidatus Binataceae bacterium]|nr:hypothetical protein [Candidatus Binataceae bacterium]HVB82342.1 hypothetical protein [Candidatus Binataceae bacterium]